MRAKVIIRKNYAPAVSVYLDGVKRQDKREIAGMLRGLMCAIEGWGTISGLTNDRFSSESPIRLEFSIVENAHYFKECVEHYFADDILERLKVKKRFYKS